MQLDDHLTLTGVLLKHLRDRPQRCALVAASAYEPDARVHHLTYEQLGGLVAQVSGALLALGVKPDDRIALLFDNRSGLEAVATLYGVHAAGAINVPINARFTAHEINELIAHTGARAAIGTDALIGQLVDATGRLVHMHTAIAAGPAPSSQEVLDWREFTAGHDLDLRPVTRRAEDYADWLHTSGTTGRPKCVMSTHRACIATGRVLGDTFLAPDESIVLTPFPFYTSSGCHSSVLTPLVRGGTCVMEPEVDVEALARRIEDERPHVLGAVPSVYGYLVDSGWLERADLSSLVTVFSGGAPLPRVILDAVLKALPKTVHLMNVYGQTETGNNGMYIDLTEDPGHGDSIGKFAMPDGDFRVVDEQGLEVAPGETGEIALAGPAVMAGYHGQSEETDRTLTDGWVLTGDLARTDQDGYLYLFDRRKDIIIRGGFNISSLEVEHALRMHQAIADAAVVAKPHTRLGEEVKAFVVERPGAQVDASDLATFCSERLADFKVPREVVFVDELPYNATGKLQKVLLRDGSWIAAGHLVSAHVIPALGRGGAHRAPDR